MSVEEGSQQSNIERHKTLLFCTLLPSLAIMDHTLLAWERPPVELAVDILQLLANMSYLTAGATAGMEGWDRLFYGCLDVVSASKLRLNLSDMARGPSSKSSNALTPLIDLRYRRFQGSFCTGGRGTIATTYRCSGCSSFVGRVPETSRHAPRFRSGARPDASFASRCERKQIVIAGCLFQGNSTFLWWTCAPGTFDSIVCR